MPLVKEMEEEELSWESKEVTTNLFLLLSDLGKIKKEKVVNFLSFMKCFNFCRVAMHYSRL